MALAPCTACRKFVSVEAKFCPGCGKPFAPGELAYALHSITNSKGFQNRSSKQGCLWAVIIIVILIAVFGIVGVVSNNPERDRQLEHDDLMRQMGKEPRR